MNKQPVLYLSYDGMTDPLGQSQVLSYLVALSKKGFTFHLISFEKTALFKQHNTYIQSMCEEHNIQWYPQQYTKKPPVISTYRDIRKMKKIAFAIQKKHQIKLIHCRSYISALVGLKLKEKRNTQLLFDMRGFWADERIEGKIWNTKNPLFKLIYTYFKRKEQQFLESADTTISLTESGKKEILSWKSKRFRPAPIEVIRCCANLDLFNPSRLTDEKKEVLAQRFNIDKTTKVLGYVGSIGTWYMLEEMMLFYAHFRTQYNATRFLFVSGENPMKIEQAAIDLNIPLKEIHVVSAMHKDVPSYLSIFDYAVFFIRPTYSKKASSPVKQGELMAMGIPVVCNTGVGDTDLIVNECNAGITIDTLNKASFSKIKLKNYSFDSAEIRKKASNYYSLEEGVEQYRNIYIQLLEKNKSA